MRRPRCRRAPGWRFPRAKRPFWRWRALARHGDALATTGVAIAPVALDAAGRVDLGAALALLAARGITRVFSEGGPRIGAELIRLGLADEIVVFTGPKPLGRGVPALSRIAREKLGDATCYRLAEDVRIGPDRMRRYERIL